MLTSPDPGFEGDLGFSASRVPECRAYYSKVQGLGL